MVPETMRALLLPRFGGPEVLVMTEVPVPAIGPDDVLIRVAYCGVCRHDLLTRAGAFPSIELPVIQGHQVSGQVVNVGSRVDQRLLGRRVMTAIYSGCGECAACRAGNHALCQRERPKFLGDDRDGGYAEYVNLPLDCVVPLPDGVSLESAAVIVCTLGTAYHALVTRANLVATETVLITGASGGVGIHAVKLARFLGARVIGVTTRQEQEATIRAAGADEVIVAPDLAFARAAKALTDGRGSDAVIDVVGSRTLSQSVHAVRNGGRIVVLGNVDGKSVELQPAHFILKEISMIGTKSCTLPEIDAVLALVVSGGLSVEVEGRVPLANGAEIHRRMESGASAGRMVLEVAGGD